MSITLEQLLSQIAAKHEVTSTEVGRMPVGDRVVWTANVHWDGHSERGITCQSGHSDKDIADALTVALNLAHLDRNPPVPALPSIPAFEVAA